MSQTDKNYLLEMAMAFDRLPRSEFRAKIFELRIAGETYASIGKKVGRAREGVRQNLERGYRRGLRYSRMTYLGVLPIFPLQWESRCGKPL